MKPKDAGALQKELSILRQQYDDLEKETNHLRKRYDNLKEEYEKLQQYVAENVQPPRVEYEGAQFIEPGAENDFYTGERRDILLSVLDDALVSFDDNRAGLALDHLKETAKDRQILLFTCQGREAAHFAGDPEVNVIRWTDEI